jgi:acyl-CoA oxidase
MPGIEVGELGAKFGYTKVDNGWMRFNHFKIPRENMLMRLTKVLPDGTYELANKAKIGYGAMMRIRLGIIMNCPLRLARSCTIATRYACVRRQFRGPDGKERKVLDYQMT